MSIANEEKPIFWIGSSKKDLMAFPVREALNNCLCGRIASLRGARNLDVYLIYASVSALRAPRASSRTDNYSAFP